MSPVIRISGTINTMGIRRKVPDTRKAKLVCQAEFAVTSAASQPNKVKTTGYGQCIIVSLISPSKKVGGLAHFDIKTEVTLSFEEVILPEFSKWGCHDLQAQMVGGLDDEESRELARKIRSTLKNKGIKITGMDLNNPDRTPGLLLDMGKMELCDVIKLLPLTEKEKRHWEETLKYLINNPESRIIRLVE